MRRIGLTIVFMCLFVPLMATNSIEIPLTMRIIEMMPMPMPLDNPTGSTPDPTDPNQFRATLTGNTLTIRTQKNEVSYVVIRSNFCEAKNEDYFYSLCFDSVSCPITQPGRYGIYIGHWNTDFIGWLIVESVTLSDFIGKIYDSSLLLSPLPRGLYIVTLKTNIGSTSTKILRL